nr:hypothetical protein GTC16762_23240 [Pigmentibacter ruber]
MIKTVKYFKNRNKHKFKQSLYIDKFNFNVFGIQCKTESQLYDHFKSELDFADYFGRNWDALIDCLSDFCWLITDKITLNINEIEYFLVDEPEKRDVFFRILFNRIEEHWKDVEFEDPDDYVTLNLVFNVTPENEKLINNLFNQYNIIESDIKEL